MNKILAFFLLTVSSFAFGQGNVGIGTITPDNSSLLDLSSNNKGLLVPRLTTQQRTNISNPANGLLVYDIDEDCFFFFQSSSSSWQSLCNTTGLQGVTGPTGATGATGASGGPIGPTGPTGSINIESYRVIGTGELTATSSFQVAPSLSITFTLTDSATIDISTFGAISQTTGNYNYVDSEIQLFLNNTSIPSAVQKNGTVVYNGAIAFRSHWSITTFLMLPQGTYTIDVRGRRLSGNSFTFGSNSNSSSALIVQVFYD